MNQLTLDDAPAARRTDPVTSHQAAAAEGRETQRARVLACLREHPAGLTDYEVSVCLDINRTSAGKRRVELQRAGLVEATSERRATDSGSTAIVWRAV